VEVISSYSQVSVTLFLDDLQWGDEASISVLNQLLLMMKDNKNFFFIGSFRGETSHDGLFWKMVKNIQEFGISSKTIKLTCMDKCTVTRVISESLCLPPRLVRSLAEIIHSKTHGNALFFTQLMLSLNRDGLLILSLSDERWVWDESQIQSRQLPDNVASVFINGIKKLSPEVQSALHTLAMFGASAKIEYLKILESSTSVNLIDPLKDASVEGLVFNTKSSFHFCHDRIQQACYNAVNQRIRPGKHLIFGRCLIIPSLKTVNNDMLFTAVNQINYGGPSAVSDAGELAMMAKYNLIAGKNI
jgi:predicted ATPase